MCLSLCVCVYILICTHMHTHILKHVRLCLYNANTTCIYVFTAAHLTLDHHLICSFMGVVIFLIPTIPELPIITECLRPWGVFPDNSVFHLTPYNFLNSVSIRSKINIFENTKLISTYERKHNAVDILSLGCLI